MVKDKNLYDAVIVGGGVAGLCAAIYLARAKYRVVVVEKDEFGGQIRITDEVVNYPGIEKTGGKKLTEAMKRQGEAFGAEFMIAEAIKIECTEDVKTVVTDKGEIKCFSILIATGAHPRVIGFEGEEEHKGRGVAYCATCDGEFFEGKEVFVVGGGFAAAEESVFLTKFARHVTVLVREEDFTCAASVAEKARQNEKITVLTDSVVEKVSGDNKVDCIVYKNLKTGETTQYKVEGNDSIGVFVFAGYEPETKLIEGVAELDEQGYVVTNIEQKTSAEGVFAAGDVCIKPLRQIVTATGDGALAATEMEKYVSKMQEKTGLKPEMRQSGEKRKEDAFGGETEKQLKAVFEKMKHKIVLRLYTNESELSEKTEKFVEEFAAKTDKIKVEKTSDEKEKHKPCVKVCTEDGKEVGIGFHGVPTGHEFTSFVLGIYNASCGKSVMEEKLAESIEGIKKKTDIKILVSLSCTMCPEVVTACQKIAAVNPCVTAEAYDIRHFGDLKEKYNVMSVPCMIVNDTEVFFGKKSIDEITELLKKA